MDLLKKLNEDAAGGSVGGGAVAAVSYPLFAKASSVIKRVTPKKKKKPGIGLTEAFKKQLGEDLTPDFDQTEVLSKLKSLEKKDKVNRKDVVTFGLEDKDGNIVRVSVQSDQAEEFQHALESFLADEEDKEDTVPEIAEILFELRDRFNIVDVVWPEVEEDQEEAQEVSPEQAGEVQPDLNADQNAMDPNADQNAEMPPADTGGDAQSLLTQVIDMMTKDAEARKAEALARKAEAEARSQDAQNRTAQSRVKQEEEMMDMENYFKQKQEMKKETKQLAKLAQWKQEVNQDTATAVNPEIDFGTKEEPAPQAREEEETGRLPTNLRSRVAPSHLADFILKRVK